MVLYNYINIISVSRRKVKRGWRDMREKTTDDLSQELMSQPNLDQYITENETYFADTDISAFLAELYEKCGLSKAALARRSGMSEVYLHQVFSGRRKPSRDRLLCL